MPQFDLWTALPVLVPAGWGLMLLLFAPAFRDDRQWLWACAVAGMTLTLLIPILMLPRLGALGDLRETAGLASLPMLRTDRLSLWLEIIFSGAGLGALLLLPRYLERARAHRPEVYPLVFLAVTGMTLMVASENLVMIFLGLEVLSLPLYILTGLTRERAASTEAALKYFLLGAFATSFLIFGLALVLGATGRLDLPGIAAAFHRGGAIAPYGPLMLLAGMALIVVGFAFKIGLAPFHFWAPDVYQGAPTPITGFMAVGVKTAAFGALLRVLHTGFAGSPDVVGRWTLALSALSIITMLTGNLMALVQQRLKRLLAFSSIGHAGYLVLALLAPLPVGAANLVFYLFAYAFMTFGAFALVSLFQDGDEDADHLDHFAGLWQRRPVLAAVMAVFMLSLTGIPPLGGFTGKYVIFMAAIQSGHPFLAAVMAVAAVIGAYYYLKVIVVMFMRPPQLELAEGIPVSVPAGIVLTAATLGTFILGLFPSLLLDQLARIHPTLTPFP